MCNVGVLVPAINLGAMILWGNVWRSNHRRALRILNSTGLTKVGFSKGTPPCMTCFLPWLS